MELFIIGVLVVISLIYIFGKIKGVFGKNSSNACSSCGKCDKNLKDNCKKI